MATPPMSAIPQELKNQPQWICWRAEVRDGKKAKVPYEVKTGRKASVADPATWATFREAISAQGYDGIGCVLTKDDPYTGIDLDHCFDPETGKLEPRSEKILTRLDSYAEKSPSGTGVHIWVKAKLPPGGRKKGQIELYDSGRYLTVTGDHLSGTPATIETRQTELETLHQEIFGRTKPVNTPEIKADLSPNDWRLIEKAKKELKFAKLWGGDTSDYPSRP